MTVLIDRREGYRVITLNRPERLNAFNTVLHETLADALDEAAADETCRALLITGAGRGFCSGQDLHDRVMKPGDVAAKAGEALLKHYNPLLKRLRALPIPVVAAVNGVAAGAGCNFALAADIVLAARSATFVEAFARIGLIPDVGGTFFLPRLAGMARARGMAMLAEAITAEQAEQGPDLEGLRRRQIDERSGGDVCAAGEGADLRARPHQARARRLGGQRSRRAASA
jgi:2-(1,2-epoxy-1,2-dihydrophenyl)acetyl-CoA isomerase